MKSARSSRSLLSALFVLLATGTALAGNVTVNITPSAAVSAGAQWQVDGGAWKASGATVKNLSNAAHTVAYKTISGWVAPASTSVTLTNNVTTTVSGAYYQPASLAVTLNPAGGQWSVDGGVWRASGTTATGLTPGAHSISYNTLANYTAPATENVTLVATQTTNLTRNYTAVSALTVTLTPASASWQLDGGAWQTSGVTLSNLAPGSHTIAYSTVSGMLPLASENISLPAAQATSIARNYTAESAIVVNLTPATAQWRVDGGPWQASGIRVGQLTAGNHTIDYSAVSGYTAPPSESITLVLGQTTTVTRSYTAVSALTITLTPSSGSWQVDGGAWQSSGATVANLTPGTHTIAYSTVSGMLPLAGESISLPGTQTTSITRAYTAESGVIVNLTPTTAQWRVDGGAWQASGARVGQLTAGSHTVDYKAVTGYATPASETITVVSGQTVTISRAYTAVSSLSVTLTPSSASWQLDGGSWQASGTTLANLTPGTHTINYETVTGMLPLPSESISLPASQTTSITRTYTSESGLVVNLTPATAQWRVDGGTWQASGARVGQLAAGNHTVSYEVVTGYAALAAETVALTSGQTNTITRNYTAVSGLTVTLTPSNGGWRVDGGLLQASGATVTGLTPGNHNITYSSLSGMISPPAETVNLPATETTAISRSYTALPRLTVNLSDPNGWWQIDSSGFRNSGVTVTNLSPGVHTLSYVNTANAIAPPTESITLQAGDAITISRNYTPAGQVHMTLSPNTGQWRVDGGAWRASNTYSGLLAAGTHTIDYSTVPNKLPLPAESINIVAAQNLSLFRSYTSESAIVINLAPPVGQWRVDGGAWHNGGERVGQLTGGSHSVEYSAVSGYTAPPNETVSLGSGISTTLTRTYLGPPSLTITVAPAVGQWRVDGGAWQPSSAYVLNLAPGSHTIEYTPAAGYIAPPTETIWMRDKQSASLSRNYRDASSAYLNVKTVPAYLSETGLAKWRVDGGDWNNAGTPAAVAAGTHTLEFQAVSGLDVPPASSVTVTTGEVQVVEATYYMIHRLRFFFHSDLVAGLSTADLQARLSQYAAHLQTIWHRQTLRRFTFDPATDISIVTATPFSHNAFPPLPEFGFEVWAYADSSNGSIFGSYGGYADLDISGAGGAGGMHWTQIYDPSTLTEGSTELYEYLKQIDHITHEFEHTFGAGSGEYYSAAGFKDLTGIEPVYSVDYFAPTDPFWNAHSDFWADPLLRAVWDNYRIGSPTTLSSVLDAVNFSATSRGIINGCYRDTDYSSATDRTLPDLSRVRVRIVDSVTGQLIVGSTLRMWHRPTPSGVAGAEEPVVDLGASGVFEFSWMANPTQNVLNNYDNAKLLKASASGYQPVTEWEWVYDAQRVKTVDGADVWEITIPLNPAP